MAKKCCGKKLGIDYSGINRIPYFAKRKDRDAWLRSQKVKARQVQEEEKVESPEPEEVDQIDQSIENQREYLEVEPQEEETEHPEAPED